MGGIALGAAEGSDFLAGLAPAVARHGSVQADYLGQGATIKSFKIAGLKVPKGQQPPRWFFTDSNISAAWIGSVSLLNVDFANLGTDFGLWAADTTPGNEIKSVKWADKADKTVKGKWPPKKGLVFESPGERRGRDPGWANHWRGETRSCERIGRPGRRP